MYCSIAILTVFSGNMDSIMRPYGGVYDDKVA